MTGSSITHANGAERLKSTQKRPNRSEKKIMMMKNKGGRKDTLKW